MQVINTKQAIERREAMKGRGGDGIVLFVLCVFLLEMRGGEISGTFNEGKGNNHPFHSLLSYLSHESVCEISSKK